MIRRSLTLPSSHSFFLFGARGTGKTTLLRERFSSAQVEWFNLLNLDTEAELSRDPLRFERRVQSLPPEITHVVIDEIQKLPKLLDSVHNLIETHRVPQVFVLTGSSARKLKAGGANLLAGRAVVRNLFPFTIQELGDSFNLEKALRWGVLPGVWNVGSEELRDDTLRAYAHTYLKEEIWGEHLVRNLEPFRRFIEVAAQTSGKIVNYTNIARDTGVDTKTVQSWFSLLEDTLVGFTLPAFHTSLRKQMLTRPKFFLFDMGVTRALGNLLKVIPLPQTSYYGELFEQFVITQLVASAQYARSDARFFYLRTKAGKEIDLIIERPGRKKALVEIKSTNAVDERDVSSLLSFADDFPDAELFLLSRDTAAQDFGRVAARHYAEAPHLLFVENT